MQGNSYRIVRSKRKTLALVIDHKANLIVRAPLNLSEKIILDFVEKKRAWIAEKQRQTLAALEKYQPITVATGEKLMFLGVFYVLRKDQVETIRITGKELTVPKQCNILQMQKWLKMQASDVLLTRAAIYAEIMGVKPNSLRISNAKTRWGSCSANNNINYAWRLIMCPIFVIDYVIVHELSHITVKNHSVAFRARVASILPYYSDAQKWLKANKHLMEVI